LLLLKVSVSGGVVQRELMKETLLAYVVNDVLIFCMEITICKSSFQIGTNILITDKTTNAF